MTARPAKAEPTGGSRLLIDLGPLLVFFAANFFAPVPGPLKVFVATGAFMVAMLGAMAYSQIRFRTISPLLWFSGVMVVVMGGLTLWLQDETFIKMKPTIYYAFVGALLGFGLATGRPLLKAVLGSTYPGLDQEGWRKLTVRWALFFLRGVAPPEITTRHIYVGIIPFVVIQIAALLVLWFVPWMTGWRVVNRLRSIAEHGGMQASSDRRQTTHHVRQNLLARFWIAPFNTGWHLAHHVDMGVPWRNLPQLHRELVAAAGAHAGNGHAVVTLGNAPFFQRVHQLEQLAAGERREVRNDRMRVLEIERMPLTDHVAAISCGIYGYPLTAATQIAVREVRAHAAQSVRQIVFACFGTAALETYLRVLGSPPPA